MKCLREIGVHLIDLHGQHENLSLLDKSSYLTLLDDFGDLKPLLQEYSESYREWRRVEQELKELELDARELRQKEDTLRFQMEEIDQAQLQSCEDTEIEQRLSVLQHSEKLSERCAEMLKMLVESETEQLPVLDQLDQLEALLCRRCSAGTVRCNPCWI